MKKWRVIIIGAGGRDFHNFNTHYRENKNVEVVAFTAAQIPDIEGRIYPKSLSGKYYPKGIPVHDEEHLEKLIKKEKIDECVLSYSDLSYDKVMHIGSRVLSCGAKFSMLGPDQTMIKSKKPVIAVVAVRTGCGKSQVSRAVVEILKKMGKRVASIRHPMPYGDLEKQKVQRFATLDDLIKHKCTIEEIEEYEPHIRIGSIIYAGVDYEAILKQAEQEADVIIWDGGNNDFSFYKPDLTITVADPLRAGHELSFYPGEVNFRLADVIFINKIDSAKLTDIKIIENNAKKINPKAQIIKAISEIEVNDPSVIKNKKVLVVEDGPTLTHGDMKIGAGTVAANRFGAKKIVDPRPFLSGKIKETFRIYPEIGAILPAMGYGKRQLKDLEKTINAAKCDSVVIGTPIDLSRYIKIKKPYTRIFYTVPKNAYISLSNSLKKSIA